VTSLEYDSYFQNPSQETSYHVQNSMKFRANEHIEDTHVELGMATNITDNVLLFITRKMPFLFLECRKWFFV
jgi:hypothetical protein